MPRLKNELLPGTLNLLVLTTLDGEPLHGYAIARRIQQISDEMLQVEEGSLYPALHRLERRGWIRASWGLSEANRRAKFYRLTGSGRRQVSIQVAAWERMSAAITKVVEGQGAGA